MHRFERIIAAGRAWIVLPVVCAVMVHVIRNDIMLTLSNIWKSYGTLIAVRDFDLRVERGETMGLIGPNGSGKTTLLRMIATMAKPDFGSITFSGLDSVEHAREVRRRIAFMPAEYGMPLDMTIREYLDYFACAHGVPRRERAGRVGDVMDLTDLTGRADIVLRGLSTGNKQRVLLAKTLLGDPEMLLLDEPASGLDPRARAEVRELVKELARMGKTIVISSHILADLEDICGEICIIELGRKIVSGNVNELRDRVATPQRRMQLRVPDDKISRTRDLVMGAPCVLRCEVEHGMLLVDSIAGSLNPILAILIEHEIEILEMREERPDLEDIFMSSTDGIVS